LLGKDDDAAHGFPRNPMEGNGDEFAARGHGDALESVPRHLRSEIRGPLCFSISMPPSGRRGQGDGLTSDLCTKWGRGERPTGMR
jgi:hypothetical protein